MKSLEQAADIIFGKGPFGNTTIDTIEDFQRRRVFEDSAGTEFYIRIGNEHHYSDEGA